MSYSTALLASSYKNVPFFVRQEQINNYGQKRIQHDYPSSSTRYEEPQGVAPIDITVDIFFSGSDAKGDYELFKLAVEDSAPGLLIIPGFGAFENIVARPANALLSQTSIGEISTSVTFSETVEKPSPTTASASSTDVASAGNGAAVSVGGAF